MKCFETIFSVYEISILDMIRYPEHVDKITKDELTHYLAKYLIDNLEELPVEISERIILGNGNKEVRLQVNLISTEEYKRLKEYENKFYEMGLQL